MKLKVAASYIRDGDKFPAKPKKVVTILDLYDRVATVKVEADDWLDYMHLVKIEGECKIVNVLGQYNDAGMHQSAR